MVTRGFLFGVLASAMSFPVYAQTATPGIDARQERQQERIEQGLASGELTKREAARLEREQARIEWHEAAAKADGVVTREERRQLHRELNRASRHIAKEKHDRQRAR